MSRSRTARRLCLVLAGTTFLTVLVGGSGVRGDAVPATVARRVPVKTAGLLSEVTRRSLTLASSGVLRSTERVTTDAVTLCAPIQFTAAALTWKQRSRADIAATIRVGDGRSSWSPPSEVAGESSEGPDVTSAEFDRTRRSTGLLWTGGGRCLRFSLELPGNVWLTELEAVFINTSGSAAPSTSWVTRVEQWWSSLFHPAPADAATRRPDMVTRRQWGANPSLMNCRPTYAPRIKMAFVHHTAGSNSYTRAQSDDVVRAIYWFHTQVNGWCDIAYNFLVDKYGKIFIGRAGGPARPVVPAAQQGFNTGSFAVSAMGNFEKARPSHAMLQSIRRVLAWRLDLAHLPPDGWTRAVSSGGPLTRYPKGTAVWLNMISSHRRTGATACPGDYLAASMRGIRSGAAKLGRPKIFRPRKSRTYVTPGETSVTFTARASDWLFWRIDIRDSNGVIVRKLFDKGDALRVKWEGWIAGPAPAPPGRYIATIAGKRADGEIARPARHQVVVTRPAP